MPRGPAAFEHVVFVCTGKDCRKAGAKKIARAIRDEIRARGLKKEARVICTKCADYCKLAPIVAVQPDAAWITGQSPEETVREAIARIAPKE